MVILSVVWHSSVTDEEECGYPEKPLHTVVTMEEGRALYSCEEGFLLHGEDMRHCQPDGAWSGEVPVCHGQYPYIMCPVCPVCSCPAPPSLGPGCPDPVAPSHGYTLLSKLADGVAIYSCQDGYLLHGQEMRYCLQDGAWGGVVPKCIGRCPLSISC